MMERLVRWIRAAVKPDIDEAFAKPAPLAEEDVAMIKSLIAAVKAMKKATMVDDRFDFGFAVDWMRKDLGLCLDEARRNGAPLPATALVDQFYCDVQRMGGGRWDTSSLIRRLRNEH